MQGALQHPQLRADTWHPGAAIKHGLRLGETFAGELGAFTAGFRGEKALGPLVAQLGAHAFDGDERHAEGAGDLGLSGRTVYA